jgi:N-methylhydantoinase A/oxoprolinase/acetone carboxylase beta subunit
VWRAQGQVLQPLDEAALRTDLQAAFDSGIRACAIVFMHGWRYTGHELAAGAWRAPWASRRSACRTRSAR